MFSTYFFFAIEPMSGEDADDINISAVFIGQDDGLTILSHYQYEKGYKLLLTDELPFNINSYLLPFAIVVAICFVVMLVFMIVKCIKDRRRMRRYRLPSSSLKTIPTSKFKKGDPYDTCAICLEDYIDGDKLRILPCAHGTFKYSL
jgi:E3 ubiquitin-protein ligase RNF13